VSYAPVVTTPEPADPWWGNTMSRRIRRGCMNKIAAYLVIFGLVATGAAWYASLSPGNDEVGELNALQVDRTAEIADERAGPFDSYSEASSSASSDSIEGPEEGPVYSVQPLANVDALTGGSTLDEIIGKGFTGFGMVGTDWDGYDVFRAGLHYREALVMESALIMAGIIPAYDLPPGFYVKESWNLR